MDTNEFIGHHVVGRRRPVSFPEAGVGAILTFDIADLEVLEKETGSGAWWGTAMAALQETHVAHIKRLAELGTKGGNYADALRTMPIAELSERLLDALMLSVFGRTAEEQEDHQARKQLERNARQLAMLEGLQNG